MPEQAREPADLIRVARLTPQTLLLLLGMGGIGLGGFSGNSKLDACLELTRETKGSVGELQGSLKKLSDAVTELRAKAEATDRLAIDTRLRQVEELGVARRLEALERELEKKGK